MANLGAVWYSRYYDWGTPQDLYDLLNDEFHFTVDVCASDWNAKHSNYWTVHNDGLKQDWSTHRCFMNPPFGREIAKWIEKAHKESMRGALVVAVIPARTDTKYWHEYIEGKHQVRFIRGRLKYQKNGPKNGENAPFPSAIVIFRPPELKSGVNVN